jgi:putative transcriptional regulator
MIKIKLKEILEEKQISIYELSKRTRISASNLSKIIKQETQSTRYNHLERICISLELTPNDILEIQPDITTMYIARKIHF